MEYLGEPLEKAAGAVLDKLSMAGGTGGLIAVDRKGNIAMPFNTPGMFRGYLKSNGEKEIAIFAP
jgi:beta-aspartyl-peptidase (threonine type)